MQTLSLLVGICSLFTLAHAADTEATHTLQVHAWPLGSSPTPFARIEYLYPSLNSTIKSHADDSTLSTLSSHPSTSSDALSSLLRIGFFTTPSQTEDSWLGILISRSNLSPSLAQKLTIRTDTNGSPLSLSLTSQSLRPLTKDEERAAKKIDREAKRASKLGAMGSSGAPKATRPSRAGASSKVAKKDDKTKAKKKESASEAASSALPTQAGLSVEVLPRAKGPKPLLNAPVKINKETGQVGENKEEEKSFFQKYWWALALFLVLQLFMGGGGEGK